MDARTPGPKLELRQLLSREGGAAQWAGGAQGRQLWALGDPAEKEKPQSASSSERRLYKHTHVHASFAVCGLNSQEQVLFRNS